MVIESRTIVGAAAAFAVVGAALWASAALFAPPPFEQRSGTVEISQIPERSWAVEVKDLGAEPNAQEVRTAVNR
ncbi:MAG TPA: hypothetical protein VF193_00260 [Steroidobacter sp.]